MNAQIERIRRVRQTLLNSVEQLSLEQLNKVPQGFNNNILWNLGHLVAGQQYICYLRQELPLVISQSIFDKYKPGSKPEAPVDETEWAMIKNLLFQSLHQLEQDIESNVFSGHTPWTSRYGPEINNIANVLDLVFFHDGLHIGYIMALKRMVAI